MLPIPPIPDGELTISSGSPHFKAVLGSQVVIQGVDSGRVPFTTVVQQLPTDVKGVFHELARYIVRTGDSFQRTVGGHHQHRRFQQSGPSCCPERSSNHISAMALAERPAIGPRTWCRCGSMAIGEGLQFVWLNEVAVPLLEFFFNLVVNFVINHDGVFGGTIIPLSKVLERTMS